MSQQGNVIANVFEDFINRLQKDETFDAKAAARLKETLLVKKDLDQESLRIALFGEEEIQ